MAEKAVAYLRVSTRKQGESGLGIERGALSLQGTNTSLTDFFDSITVISLPQRTDRRREATSELAKLGLTQSEFAFFDACRPDSAGDFPTIGYHGCFKSHLSVLAAIAERPGTDLHLVLEDDFAFKSDAMEHLRAHWSALEDADLLLLGVLEITSSSHYDKESFVVAPGFEFIGTHAYAVRARTAALMATYFQQMYERPAGDPKGGPMSPDGAVSWFRNAHPAVATKLIWPFLCGQRPSRTDVHDLHWFDRVPVLRECVQLLRRFR